MARIDSARFALAGMVLSAALLHAQGTWYVTLTPATYLSATTVSDFQSDGCGAPAENGGSGVVVDSGVYWLPYPISPDIGATFQNGQWVGQSLASAATTPYAEGTSTGTTYQTFTFTMSRGGIETISQSDSTQGVEVDAGPYYPYAPISLPWSTTFQVTDTANLNTGIITHTGSIIQTGTCEAVTGKDANRDVVYGVATYFWSRTFSATAIGTLTFAPIAAQPTVTLVNPFAPFMQGKKAPVAVDAATAISAPPASAIAADGHSALVVVVNTPSLSPVTLSLSATGINLANPAVAALAPFDSGFLPVPKPLPPNAANQQIQLSQPDLRNADGSYTFLALLWGPPVWPVPDVFPAIGVTVTATQTGASSSATAYMNLMPPPLLLVHGIWSSADEAWPLPPATGFPGWIQSQYPHDLIGRVDYGAQNDKQFSDSVIQSKLLASMEDVLAKASNEGMAARQVDVVAHSMGGLVTRYFMSQGPPLPAPELPANPVHKLITIGTPHLGTQIATVLELNQNDVSTGNGFYDVVSAICLAKSIYPCTLGNVFAAQGKKVDSGVQSLEPGSTALLALNPNNPYDAVEGLAPGASLTELQLNMLVGSFLPGQTIETILGTPLHDTLVTSTSQAPPAAVDSVTIQGLVHTALSRTDTGETRSPAFWQQAYHWLTGGSGAAPAAAPAGSEAARLGVHPRTASSAPILNLSGYTQVASSNATFSPASGAALTVNTEMEITATSATKIITEVLLFQQVSDPTDLALLDATAAPFSIAFTPTQMGTASFTAITLFSDNTYAVTGLDYTLAPGGSPYTLTLVNAPIANMSLGASRVVRASALFSSGAIDVTQAATFQARSGGSSVFSISAGGTITATGNGVDWLDVGYGGLTTSAEISVGSCSFTLGPNNQTVPFAGGPVMVQVLAPAGCAWTAAISGDTSWLTLQNQTGTGNGTITASAAPNNTGNPLVTAITLPGLVAALTQPATACSYGTDMNQINASSAGASGTIAVNTSCPIVVSSNASWLSGTSFGTAVAYYVAPNTGSSSRSATLTIGSVPVSVSQAPGNACDLQNQGLASVSDVQILVNGALGLTSPGNDLNGDGQLNIVDIQIEINAALGLPCAAM